MAFTVYTLDGLSGNPEFMYFDDGGANPNTYVFNKPTFELRQIDGDPYAGTIRVYENGVLNHRAFTFLDFEEINGSAPASLQQAFSSLVTLRRTMV